MLALFSERNTLIFYKHHDASDFTLFSHFLTSITWTSPKNIELFFKSNESLVYLMRKTPIKNAKKFFTTPHFLRKRKKTSHPISKKKLCL